MENAFELETLKGQLTGKSAEELLKFAAQAFAGEVVFATSLSAEDQVITDIIARNDLAIPIITLDTGRLFEATYELIDATEKFFGVRIEIFFPDSAKVENLVRERGINLFRHSIADRKACCRVRKIEPLRRALAGKRLWICGQRREQSVTRTEIEEIEDDPANGLWKLNPLATWSAEQVRRVVSGRGLPYNRLHDVGFPSIGCECCTRAVRWTEDFRAGRWWWEPAEKRECGLHAHAEKLRREREATGNGAPQPPRER